MRLKVERYYFMFDVYMCPNTECWYDKNTGNKGEHCPECGTLLQKVGIRESSNLIQQKKELKKDPTVKARQKEYKRLQKLLFSDETVDADLKGGIEEDMLNLASHEAGTKWMRVGTLLSFNSTEQMIGAGFKALIDQNKIIIKQNEQILRALKNLNNE